jgi:hypothetical protein
MSQRLVLNLRGEPHMHMQRTIYRGALPFAAALWSICAYAQVSVLPANPKQFETVRVEVPQGALGLDLNGLPDFYSAKDTQISMAGNRITVSLLMIGNSQFGVAQPSPPVDLPIGQFPSGTFSVEVVKRATGAGRAGQIGSTSFSAAARSATDPQWDHTDMWWNPDESGWGLNVVQHGGSGVIVATWFVYGTDGKPIWYIVPGGSWANANEFRGSVYRTTGPYFGGPFDPATVTATLVGTATLGFDPIHYDLATAVLNVEGVNLIKQIQRLPF